MSVTRLLRIATAAAAGIIAMALAMMPHPTASAEDPVIIGAIYNLTGTQSGLDIPSSEGALLATEEANRAGGVLGRPVTLVLRNGETVPATVAKQVAAILTDFPSVAAFIGLSDTDMLKAAEPVAAAAGRVFLTSGASSPKLPSEEPTYLFLACFGDNVQAAAAAEWAYAQLGARSAAVLFNSEMEYTRLLHGYFATRFAQLGGSIVSTAGYRPDAIAESFADVADADILYLSAGPADAVAAVPKLRAAGFNQPVVGGDGFDSSAWARLPDITDVYFSTHAYLGADNPDPRVVAFRAAFAKAYPATQPDSFSALGYDAVNLILSAVARAGSDAPEKVLAALAKTRDFAGVTGTLSYDDASRIPRKSVAIVAISGGTFSPAAQLVPSDVPAP